jgi:hypothetical protein
MPPMEVTLEVSNNGTVVSEVQYENMLPILVTLEVSKNGTEVSV